jgi:hypothetical protein
MTENITDIYFCQFLTTNSHKAHKLLMNLMFYRFRSCRLCIYLAEKLVPFRCAVAYSKAKASLSEVFCPEVRVILNILPKKLNQFHVCTFENLSTAVTK